MCKVHRAQSRGLCGPVTPSRPPISVQSRARSYRPSIGTVVCELYITVRYKYSYCSTGIKSTTRPGGMRAAAAI